MPVVLGTGHPGLSASYKDTAWDESARRFHGILKPGRNQSPFFLDSPGDNEVVHLVRNGPIRCRHHTSDLAGAVAIHGEIPLFSPCCDGSFARSRFSCEAGQNKRPCEVAVLIEPPFSECSRNVRPVRGVDRPGSLEARGGEAFRPFPCTCLGCTEGGEDN